MSMERRAPSSERTRPRPRCTAVCKAMSPSSTRTQRSVASAERATTASMMALPTQAMPSGTKAATSVSSPSATVPPGDERQTSLRVRRACAMLSRRRASTRGA